MSTPNIRGIVESVFTANSITDTWEDVVETISEELVYVGLGGPLQVVREALEEEYTTTDYPGIDWSGIDAAATTDATNSDNIFSNPGGGFALENITIPASSALVLSSTVNAPVLQFWKLKGISAPVLTGTGFDPGNVSTNEAGLTNGDITDLVYNNSASGAVNGMIMALDLGSPQDIGAIGLEDWGNGSGPTYSITAGDIVTSNDGSNWTTDQSFTGKPYTNNPGTEWVINPVVNARYVGIRYTAGNNPTFWVMSEMTAKGAPTGGDAYAPISATDNEFFSVEQNDANFELSLINKTASAVDLRLRSNRQ